jgi:hypothetical protein
MNNSKCLLRFELTRLTEASVFDTADLSLMLKMVARC